MPKPKPSYTFYIYQDRRGEFRWRLKHRNGNVVADSGEGYKRRAACDKATAKFALAVYDAAFAGAIATEPEVIKRRRPQLRPPR